MNKKRIACTTVVSALESIGGTQCEIAKKLKISQGMVSAMIVGEKIPGWKTCIKIEAATHGAFKREQLRPDIFGSPRAAV